MRERCGNVCKKCWRASIAKGPKFGQNLFDLLAGGVDLEGFLIVGAGALGLFQANVEKGPIGREKTKTIVY